MAILSDTGGDDTAGYRVFRDSRYTGTPGPFRRGNLTDSSAHLWRAELPADLPEGVHTLTVETTDRHGRTFSRDYTFEVVEQLPNPFWQSEFWLQPG